MREFVPIWDVHRVKDSLALESEQPPGRTYRRPCCLEFAAMQQPPCEAIVTFRLGDNTRCETSRRKSKRVESNPCNFR
jgi:hypothetical protein